MDLMYKKHGFRRAFNLVLEYTSIGLATQFSHRIDAILRAVAVFFREFASVAIVLLAISKFPSLGGWTHNEIMFLFSLLFLSYAFLVSFFTGFRDFEDIVHTGGLDRMLLRPRGIMFQLMVSRADYLAAIGQGSVGVLLFLFAIQSVPIYWDLGKCLFLVASIISGTLIQGAVFIFFSTMNLFTAKSGNSLGQVYYSLRRFAIYPLDIFPAALQLVLTFGIPFAFVNYYPAAILLGKTGTLVALPFAAVASVGLGILLIVVVFPFWRAGLRRYNSSGH